MKTADDAISSLSAALIEALEWLYIEGKKPPYVVPFCIDHDHWKSTRADGPGEAKLLIREAVAKAAAYEKLGVFS